MEKMNLEDWSFFLALTSSKLYWAWDRQANEGFGCIIGQGLPTKHWSMSVHCPERKRIGMEPSEDDPATIEIKLLHNTNVVETIRFHSKDEHSDLGENYIEMNAILLKQWTELLQKHCLES